MGDKWCPVCREPIPCNCGPLVTEEVDEVKE